MTRTLASLILLLVASPLWADIPQFRVGDKIILEAGFEADDYDWRVAGAQLLELDNGKSVAVWAAPGRKYDWDVSGALVVDGKGQVKRNGGQFEVTTEPAPPTPATLRELVSDPEAELIAVYLRTLASQVGQIQSAEHFWAVWNSTTAAGFPVRGNTKLDAALMARLTPAIEKKTGLSVELRAIADEFDKEGPEPPKPPVVEGKRLAIIVHESEDKSPEFGALLTELRKPGSNADTYLKTKGHTLVSLDDELLRESKYNALVGGKLDSLPKLFVIDPQTNAILFESVIAAGTTADNITERIRETGG